LRTLVIAPHPDDELLGCGGTLLRRRAEGGTVGWLLMTSITADGGWSAEQTRQRAFQIERVREGLSIAPENLYQLGFNPADLDKIPMNILVPRLADVFNDFQPEEVFLPHPGDAHSDHRITFEAACACTKWFRYPSVKRVLTYETLSETDSGLDQSRCFHPTSFVDICEYLERKIELMGIYESEIGIFPFPRSELAMESLARLRGAQAGFMAAEAFVVLKERI
jgi:LmbE family N-acetylglucosaminyl deacetylase